ncbi:hypothetical protein [Tautonia rosea]|uniref:hypothetical protein n=1 Tax=Tautonia rosea TaxID=2728037 RepID=UPI001473175B|nr:hypothetical protein [Tautonia rosea]
MAFITLRRTRTTSSYYLVESYRDESGRSRKRTLCYLGREYDGVDTLEKALAHWQEKRRQALRTCEAYRGERRTQAEQTIRAIEAKLSLIRLHLKKQQAAEAERRERERRAEEAAYWQAFAILRREPSEAHYREAKCAYRKLAMRYHPDQGGDHTSFVRLQRAFDDAVSRYRIAA